MEKETKLYDEIYKELMVSFQGIDEKIKMKKEEKKTLRLKSDLYNKCLDDHLLEKGSKHVKMHLDETKKLIKEIDEEIEELTIEKDAYRIELEVFQKDFREA